MPSGCTLSPCSACDGLENVSEILFDQSRAMQGPDLTGKTILITAGEFAGEEGVCLGRAPDGGELWAVSPASSDRIVNLRFDEGLGVLLNSGQSPGRN